MVVHRHDDYLEIIIRGNATVENVVDYLKSLHTICQSLRCRNLLMIEDLGGALTVGEIFDVLMEAARAFDPPLRKIAYMDLAPHRDPSRSQFTESVARNHGVPLSLFHDKQQAIAWLQSQENAC